MATPNISFNPYIATVANAGMFNTTSEGVRQGTAYPDPATRFALRTGVLAAAETIPMWGGVGIFENVPGGVGNPSFNLGPVVGRADSLTGAKALAGFSVFDQAYGMVTSPQSPVPLVGSYGQVLSYALGSRARIAVACDPALVSLRTGPIGANVSWDFVAQRLVPYNASALTISSGTYNSTTGAVVLTMSAAINFGVGDDVVISALTGTGGFASLNGNYTTTTGTTGTTVNYTAATGLGATTITGGTLTLGSGSGSILPVKVLNVISANCEVVSYNSTTGFATYDYNGACAIIQI